MNSIGYSPPQNDLVRVMDNGKILLGPKHTPFFISVETAISLGLALMETGLHLKQMARDSAEEKARNPAGQASGDKVELHGDGENRQNEADERSDKKNECHGNLSNLQAQP